MAEKRMISATIIDSDIFLDMPATTQNLYFHLNLRADDEGFIDSPKKVMRIINANQNDLDILLAKNYLLIFDSGVIVIKHWKIHNTIRKDRMKPTMYLEEKSQLFEKENGSYTFTQYNLSIKDASNQSVEYLEQPATKWQPVDNQETADCTHSLDKISLDKSRLEEINKEEKNTKKENSNFDRPVYENYPSNVSSTPVVRDEPTKLSKLITQGINHWNSKPNLPACRYTVITLPNNKLADITNMFDVHRNGEILTAIDNLSKAYDSIDQTYRPKNFQNFITTSLDNWFEERSTEPVKRNYRTEQERRFFDHVLKMSTSTPEWIEEMKVKCIDSLIDIGEEFIDYEKRD